MNDELRHYGKGKTKPGAKYFKREWKNGHWRYYYHERQLFDSKEYTAKEAFNEYQDHLDESRLMDLKVKQEQQTYDSLKNTNKEVLAKIEAGERLRRVQKIADEEKRQAELKSREAERQARDAGRMIVNNKTYARRMKTKQAIIRFKVKGKEALKKLGIEIKPKIKVVEESKWKSNRPISRKKKKPIAYGSVDVTK